MRSAKTCPDSAWWNDLLDQRLSDREQAGLGVHLEDCVDCQQTLERLTASDATWGDAGRCLAEQSRPIALRRTMEKLKMEATRGTQPGEETVAFAPAALDLTFLRPPLDPHNLGRLDGYEVLEIIGRGGMGVVLKAVDPRLQRIVAIKMLAMPWATSAAARVRFEREARATASVRHDHVVAVHAVGEVDGLPYLVMEYVAGASLQQHLDRAGPLEVEEIVRIGMQTASGLAAAHAQGLIHRDVKPANILLEGGVGRAKLSDFGLARAVDDASLTQSGVIAGTPNYMAPEQAAGASLDFRTDLFSLGSVLYALCTGVPPFRAPTTLAVIKRVCDDEPDPIRDSNPEIPAWLIDIVATLHRKRPDERFASADEVAQLLGKFQRHLRSPGTEKRPRLPRRSRVGQRRWWLLVPVLLAGAMLPVLLCAGVAYWALNMRPGDAPQAKQEGDPPPLQDLAADDPAFVKVVADLESDNLFTRVAAAGSLAQIKPNEQRPQVALKLAKLVDHEDFGTRHQSLRALSLWGTPKEVPKVIEALSHKDVFTRREALKVIGPFKDERALAPVIRCFTDFHTREDAKTALRDMGSMAEKDVLALTNGKDVFLKVDAIKVLRDIGTDASVPALQAAVASNDPFLAPPAREALAAIAARAKR